MTPFLFLQDGDCLPCDAWGSLFAFGSEEEGERAAYSNDNGGCVKHVAHAGEGGEDSSKQETEEAENGRGVSGVFPFPARLSLPPFQWWTVISLACLWTR